MLRKPLSVAIAAAAHVAHDPREDVDDEPENQCRRYREEEASHFVELTPRGELIRAE